MGAKTLFWEAMSTHEWSSEQLKDVLVSEESPVAEGIVDMRRMASCWSLCRINGVEFDRLEIVVKNGCWLAVEMFLLSNARNEEKAVRLERCVH